MPESTPKPEWHSTENGRRIYGVRLGIGDVLGKSDVVVTQSGAVLGCVEGREIVGITKGSVYFRPYSPPPDQPQT